MFSPDAEREILLKGNKGIMWRGKFHYKELVCVVDVISYLLPDLLLLIIRL